MPGQNKQLNTLTTAVIIAVLVSSASTALAFQWSDWNMTGHVKDSMALLDVSEPVLSLQQQADNVLLAYGRFTLKQQERVLGQVAGTAVDVIPAKAGIQSQSSSSGSPIKHALDSDRGSGMTQPITQEVTKVIKEIKNYTVKASLTEQELVGLVSQSQILQDILRGPKGEKGDAGVSVSYTLPTSTNTSSIGTIAGFTHLSGQDISAQTLTISGTTTLTSITNNLSIFAATTSAQLAGVISDETGSGNLVFATAPTLITPILGDATATSIAASSATSRMSIGNILAASTGLQIGNSGFIGTSQYGINIVTTGSSSATNTLRGLAIGLSTQAASFTVPDLFNIIVNDASKGAGSTITNQFGVYVGGLTSGTNNYGFYGGVVAAANRYNLYMPGTAQNYLAGNLGISIASPTEKLHIGSGGSLIVDSGNMYSPFGGFGRYQNYLTYSEQINNAAWVKSGGGTPTVNANAAAGPDGATTADEIVWTNPTAGTETVNQDTGINPASKTYTVSFWIKQGTTATVTNTRVRLLAGATSATGHPVALSVPTNWERRSFTVTWGAGDTGNLNFRFEQQTDHGAGRMLIWGVQVEEASTSNIYARTEATAITGVQRSLVAQSSGNILLNSGNVGIGMSVPTSKLEINGDIRITSGSGGKMYFADGTSRDSAGAVVQTSTSTGTQNDFAVTDARHLILRLNNASLLTITGFTAGANGDIIDVVSVGAGNVEFSPQTGSTAANQLINFATVGNTPLKAGFGTARYIYDGTTARWRLVKHEQGGWITPTFSAGDYTGTDGGSWTVDAGDVQECKYWLQGRILTVSLRVVTTSVGGTPGALRRAIPGGFTDFGADYAQVLSYGTDNSSTNIAIRLDVNVYIEALPLNNSWANSTNNTIVNYKAIFEVD